MVPPAVPDQASDADQRDLVDGASVLGQLNLPPATAARSLKLKRIIAPLHSMARLRCAHFQNRATASRMAQSNAAVLTSNISWNLSGFASIQVPIASIERHSSQLLKPLGFSVSAIMPGRGVSHIVLKGNISW